jgi:hypothetical protein
LSFHLGVTNLRFREKQKKIKKTRQGVTYQAKIGKYQPFPISCVKTNDGANESYGIPSSYVGFCPLEHIYGVSDYEARAR